MLTRASSVFQRLTDSNNTEEGLRQAQTALQLAVVLGSVAILALNRWILIASAALGVLGALLVANGYLMLVPLA